MEPQHCFFIFIKKYKMYQRSLLQRSLLKMKQTLKPLPNNNLQQDQK